MLRMLFRFFKQERGNAALEFALIIPLFFLLVFTALDILKIQLAENQLNQLAGSLAFYGKNTVSRTGTPDLTSADLTTAVNQFASAPAAFPLSSDGLTASTRAFTDLMDFSSGRVVNAASPAGLPGQIIVYQLDFLLELNSPILMLLYSSKNATLSAATVVKNGQ